MTMVKDRMVNQFIEFVRIASESGNERVFLEHLRTVLESEFTGEISLDGYGNLLAKLPAKRNESRETLMFCCHSDTVPPGVGIEPVLRNGILHSRGNTVLGADDKSGIAELLEGVRLAKSHPNLELVFTRQEETGHIGAKRLELSSLKARYGFVLDGEDLTTIINGGPSNVFIIATLLGKAAHAGIEPESGISAIRIACAAISMVEEGWVTPRTTVNIGKIEGGRARNTVPDEVKITGECRSLDHRECMQRSQRIKELFERTAAEAGAEARVDLDLAYKAFNVSEDSNAVRIAREAVRSIGLSPKVEQSRGASDASTLNERSIECVALGTGVRAPHTTQESIAVEDMHSAARIVSHILEHCYL